MTIASSLNWGHRGRRLNANSKKNGRSLNCLLRQSFGKDSDKAIYPKEKKIFVIISDA